MTTTTYDIIKIWFQIAQDFPLGDLCNSINGFSTSTGSNDLLTSNVGKVPSDFEKGFFWSRDWEASGRNQDELKLEYNALIIENQVSTIPDLSKNDMCDEFDVLVIAPYDCPECKDCSPCNRNRDEVKIDTKKILAKAIRNFMTYELWKCEEEIDGEIVVSYIWISTGRLEWLKENCPDDYKCFTKRVKRIKAMVKNKATKIYEWEGDTGMYKTGHMATIEVCGCEDYTDDFDYSKKEYKQLATTSCIGCS